MVCHPLDGLQAAVDFKLMALVTVRVTLTVPLTHPRRHLKLLTPAVVHPVTLMAQHLTHVIQLHGVSVRSDCSIHVPD